MNVRFVLLCTAFVLQVSPGQYNPDALQALDFVVAEAGAWGIQVVISMIDYWKYYNGVAQVRGGGAGGQGKGSG